MKRGAGIAIVLSVVAWVAGCGGSVNTRTIEEVSQETRGQIDDLAALVGTDPEVEQDDIIDCGLPGENVSGRDMIYIVSVTVEPGAIDRIRGEIAEQYRDEGWIVEPWSEVATGFDRDRVGINVIVSSDGERASVGGSGGCAR